MQGLKQMLHNCHKQDPLQTTAVCKGATRGPLATHGWVLMSRRQSSNRFHQSDEDESRQTPRVRTVMSVVGML